MPPDECTCTGVDIGIMYQDGFFTIKGRLSSAGNRWKQ